MLRLSARMTTGFLVIGSIFAAASEARADLPIRGVWVNDDGIGHVDVYRIAGGVQQVAPNVFRGYYTHQFTDNGVPIPSSIWGPSPFYFTPANPFGTAGIIRFTRPNGPDIVTPDFEDFTDQFMTIFLEGQPRTFTRVAP